MSFLFPIPHVSSHCTFSVRPLYILSWGWVLAFSSTHSPYFQPSNTWRGTRGEGDCSLTFEPLEGVSRHGIWQPKETTKQTMPQLWSGIFWFYAHTHIAHTSMNVIISVLYIPLTEKVKLDSKLTFSADHLSWECSAYLLAKYSSFSGSDMLGEVNAWHLNTKAMTPS